MVADSRGLEARRVPSDVATLTEAARRFTQLCEDPSSQLASTQYLGRDLYHRLLSPVADRLERQRLVLIEPDPDLKLPFQALTDTQGRYLIEANPVVYIPGLYYLFGLRTDEQQTGNGESSLVVAGNAAFQPGELRPLPDVESEAREVAKRLPSSHLLLGRDATLATIRSRLSQATHFHFGGHAARMNGTAGLLLADTDSNKVDVLDSSELSRLKLGKLQMATLAACSTENAAGGGLDDWESLARAFLRAGVPHVVASGWNVESGASRELMVMFYDKLQLGMSTGRALAVAELEMSRVPGKEGPYYWAGFDAFGRN